MEATILFEVLLSLDVTMLGDKSFKEFTVATFVFSEDVFGKKVFWSIFVHYAK